MQRVKDETMKELYYYKDEIIVITIWLSLLLCGLQFQSYKDLTGTSWSLLYFISFYLITVLLLLNLVSY